MGKTKVSNNHWYTLAKKSSGIKTIHVFFELSGYKIPEPDLFYFSVLTKHSLYKN